MARCGSVASQCDVDFEVGMALLGQLSHNARQWVCLLMNLGCIGPETHRERPTSPALCSCDVRGLR